MNLKKKNPTTPICQDAATVSPSPRFYLQPTTNVEASEFKNFLIKHQKYEKRNR